MLRLTLTSLLLFVPPGTAMTRSLALMGLLLALMVVGGSADAQAPRPMNATPQQMLRDLPPLTGAAPAPAPGQALFTDPEAFCRAVRTIDEPDSRYKGPPVTEVMAAAFGKTVAELEIDRGGGVKDSRLEWRCLNGAILACVTLNSPVCGKQSLNITTDMQKFCRQNANQDIPASVAGRAPVNWKCVGQMPTITRVFGKLDERGFNSTEWKRVGGAAARLGAQPQKPSMACIANQGSLGNPGPLPELDQTQVLLRQRKYSGVTSPELLDLGMRHYAGGRELTEFARHDLAQKTEQNIETAVKRLTDCDLFTLNISGSTFAEYDFARGGYQVTNGVQYQVGMGGVAWQHQGNPLANNMFAFGLDFVNVRQVSNLFIRMDRQTAEAVSKRLYARNVGTVIIYRPIGLGARQSWTTATVVKAEIVATVFLSLQDKGIILVYPPNSASVDPNVATLVTKIKTHFLNGQYRIAF